MKGYVVVLFGGAEKEWCSLSHCPQGVAEWFEDKDSAIEYAIGVPEAFEPHILSIRSDDV